LLGPTPKLVALVLSTVRLHDQPTPASVQQAGDAARRVPTETLGKSMTDELAATYTLKLVWVD